jgi:hypothetical protein
MLEQLYKNFPSSLYEWTLDWSRCHGTAGWMAQKWAVVGRGGGIGGAGSGWRYYAVSCILFLYSTALAVRIMSNTHFKTRSKQEVRSPLCPDEAG